MATDTRDLAVQSRTSPGALAMWDDEQIEIIKRLICPDATDTELALFGQVCQRTGLDPFAKQIYGIKRKGRLTIQTGIDGFRLQAQRSRDYAGQEGPQWAGEDGVWRDVWLSKDPPAAARVGVYRKGWTRPVWGVATWNEYAQMYNGQPTDMWKNMPSNQLAKCAEAQALRKAFPAELSGLYAREEMDQAANEGGPIIEGTTRPGGGDLPCDKEAYLRTWHSIVKDTRFEDDETRHKFMSFYTKGSCSSLADFLAGATDEDARGLMVAIQRHINAEGKKARESRAALEAELRTVIEAALEAGGSVDMPEDLSTLSDAEIRALIDPLRDAVDAVAVPA